MNAGEFVRAHIQSHQPYSSKDVAKVCAALEQGYADAEKITLNPGHKASIKRLVNLAVDGSKLSPTKEKRTIRKEGKKQKKGKAKKVRIKEPAFVKSKGPSKTCEEVLNSLWAKTQAAIAAKDFKRADKLADTMKAGLDFIQACRKQGVAV